MYVGADDPRVAIYRDVKDRDVAGRGPWFILEGENSVANLVKHGRIPLASVCISTRRVAPMAALIAELGRAEVPVYALEQEAMEALVGFNFHRGVLGCGVRPRTSPPSELLRRHAWGEGTIVIGENVTNLDNIGAIFRNAAAFGVRAVLLDEQSSDPYYRKAIRVSGGHALVVPFTHSSTSLGCIAAAREAGYAVLALVTPHSDKAPPASIVDWRVRHPRRPVALLLGAEGPGLSQAAVDLADAAVTIPIVHHVDSLNVATACAVALHETTARRGRPRVLDGWSFGLGVVVAFTLGLGLRSRG